ncbi:MAG TPA: hypothetical protein VGO53_15925 [Steroidobacteraceae bacterium]|jgi:hypothetical protein|nr:hypothetical protein [Steroidobacteraceae bacterium]
MDLGAPDVARIFPTTELQEKLPEPGEEEIAVVDNTVQVSGKRQLTPVSVGIMAIPWALRHPTQAWRIFVPMQASDTK